MFNSIKYKHTILDNENPLKGTSTLVTLVSSLRNSIQKAYFCYMNFQLYVTTNKFLAMANR